MEQLPQDIIERIGSYLPSNAEATRAVVLQMDPYNPEVITAMLELGIDPWTIVTKERERLREKDRLQKLKAFKLVPLIYSCERWYMENLQSGRVWVEFRESVVIPHDEIAKLGYTTEGRDIGGLTAYVITDPGNENLFSDIVAIDRFFHPHNCDMSVDTHDSLGDPIRRM
jgi:hypothetical protein